MWYRLVAYNSETRYGWTESEDVVDACVAALNRDKQINLYHAEALGESVDTADSSGTPLVRRDDHIFNADSTPDDLFEQ